MNPDAAAEAPPAPEGMRLIPLERRRGWLVLPPFAALSLAAHGAMFLLFQVVYPQRVTLPPPASQVALLTPATPEHEALLRWVAAEDPALVAATTHAMPASLLDVPYRASFEMMRTPPRFAPPSPEVIAYPPAKELMALIRGLTAAPSASAPEPAPSATRLLLSDALQSRAPVAPPAFSVRAATPLQPARFLLGISGTGEVRFTFLQKSSGDPAADTAAAAQLTGITFRPAADPLAWGFATIRWGLEAHAAPPPPP